MRLKLFFFILSGMFFPFSGIAQGSNEPAPSNNTQEVFFKSFCDSFTKVVATMNDKFTSLKGAETKDIFFSYWNAKIPLPGAVAGRVEKSMAGEYAQYYFGKSSDSIAASRIYLIIRDAVGKCMPPGWYYEQKVGPDAYAASRVAAFYLFDELYKTDEYKLSGKYISLELFKNGNDLYEVVLKFDPHI